jgi:HAD superfamily hydrolase (TIGR01509 family)
MLREKIFGSDNYLGQYHFRVENLWRVRDPDLDVRGSFEALVVKEALGLGEVEAFLIDVHGVLCPYDDWEIPPPISKRLEELMREIPIVAVISDGGRRRLKEFGNRYGLRAINTEKEKSSPDSFGEAVSELSIPADKTVFIGDFLTEMVAAKDAGLKTILVRPYAEWKEPLFYGFVSGSLRLVERRVLGYKHRRNGYHSSDGEPVYERVR